MNAVKTRAVDPFWAARAAGTGFQYSRMNVRKLRAYVRGLRTFVRRFGRASARQNNPLTASLMERCPDASKFSEYRDFGF